MKRRTPSTLPTILCMVCLAAALAGCPDPELGQQTGQPPQQPDTLSAQQKLDSALAAGCDGDRFFTQVEDFLQADAAAREQGFSPDSADYDQALEAAGVARFDTLLVFATTLHMNNSHDCQRLILEDEEGNRHYGPLVGIFLDPAQVAAPTTAVGGELRAEVFSFTAEAYPTLGINGRGVHCLSMTGGPGGWSDAILYKPSPTTGEPDCAQSTPPALQPGDPGYLNTTRRQLSTGSPPSPPPHTYPRTGRWMWDENTELQYIGIACGEAWCDLAPQGVQTPTAPFADSRDIPGWFDTQLLAHHQGQAGAGLRVSEVRGTIAPGPGVQFPTPAAQATALGNGWMTAAVITLDDMGSGPTPDPAVGFYQTKLDLNGTPGQPNRIAMRITPGGQIEGMAPGSNGPQVMTSAVSFAHSGLGTVRWRWSEADEEGWIPCRGGCCTWF